ncbi:MULTISPECIES: hypothetical protein [Streptomyces]|uniref:Uncharacterized protein n=1 Tax=Streptomyces sudanensis TaxID=436397 RepID=A0ABY4T7Y3_9ACTN|nr:MULTISPECIES: hypothetical protein [Streptomyces]URN14812.1 hypothetical protein MW084_01485 [Streptomyces sudanensis]
MRQVTPLGIFGRIADQSAFARLVKDLVEGSEGIPKGERAAIGAYLRDAPVILALMGYTEDVLEGRFAVTGGSAIHSDGTWFWRRDTAEYVETYGTGLPEDFLRAGRAAQWSTPRLTREEVQDIEDYFVWARRQRT